MLDLVLVKFNLIVSDHELLNAYNNSFPNCNLIFDEPVEISSNPSCKLADGQDPGTPYYGVYYLSDGKLILYAGKDELKDGTTEEKRAIDLDYNNYFTKQ